MTKITKTVWILSFVSLFTDIASEMLYPVMPVYLKNIGFSALLIGILEGLSEATAGLSKGYFGNLSDRKDKRVPFIRAGYTLSAISKPMLALSAYPLWIFLSRTTDRLGKGMRTSARDAILSNESTPGNKGRIFGLHRALDTFGAFTGPILALIFLFLYPGNYTTLFLLAFIPGIISISLTLVLKEKPSMQKASVQGKGFFSFIHYWNKAGKNYRKLVTGLLFFSLINSSDVFLLLMAKHSGISDIGVIGLYVFYNAIYAIFSYPVGIMADKIGLKNIYVSGLFLFAFVYGTMAFIPEYHVILFLFAIYGFYASATESIAKAWISNTTDKKDTATALGFYNGFSSIFTMAASFIAGLLWNVFSPSVPFFTSASGALLLAAYFLITFRKAADYQDKISFK